MLTQGDWTLSQEPFVNYSRSLVIGCAAVFPVLALGGRSDVLPLDAPFNPCMSDSIVLSHVQHQILGVLGPIGDEDSSTVNYRVEVGLAGTTLNDVVVISDSSTCEAARVAFTMIALAGISDTAYRRNFEESTEEILVIRLGASRYLLTTYDFDPVSLWRQFLVDSTFQLVSNGFAMGSAPEKRSQSHAALAGATPRSAGFTMGSIQLVSTKSAHAVASPLAQSQRHRRPTRRDSVRFPSRGQHAHRPDARERKISSVLRQSAWNGRVPAP
jgi:hypothetical protein